MSLRVSKTFPNPRYLARSIQFWSTSSVILIGAGIGLSSQYINSQAASTTTLTLRVSGLPAGTGVTFNLVDKSGTKRNMGNDGSCTIDTVVRAGTDRVCHAIDTPIGLKSGTGNYPTIMTISGGASGYKFVGYTGYTAGSAFYMAPGTSLLVSANYAPIVSPTPPPPPPAPAPAPSPAPKPSPVPAVPPPVTPPPPPPAPADAAAPSAPSELKAAAAGGAVDLSWQAATDDIGVVSYLLERSFDASKWDLLAESVAALAFKDPAAPYSTKLFYRVQAMDAVGNKGAFAQTDITTDKFESSVQSSGITVESDDNKVMLRLTALGDNANCSVTMDEEAVSSLPTAKLTPIAGPYFVLCKRENGEVIERFDPAGSLTFKLSQDEVKGYSSFRVVTYDEETSSWEVLNSNYDKKSRQITAAASGSGRVAVLGVVKGPFPWWILIIGLLTLGVFAAAIAFRLHQVKQAKYQEYLRRKYYEL